MTKKEIQLYSIEMALFAGRFYIAYYEKTYLIAFLTIYLVVIYPISILTYGTEDVVFMYFSNAIWFFSFYFLLVKNCLFRGSYIKKIKKIDIMESHIVEKDLYDNVLRRISFYGKKISYVKRSKKNFDLVICGGDFLGGLFDRPFGGAIDFGINPYIYIASNIDIEHLQHVQEILKSQEEKLKKPIS